MDDIDINTVRYYFKNSCDGFEEYQELKEELDEYFLEEISEENNLKALFDINDDEHKELPNLNVDFLEQTLEIKSQDIFIAFQTFIRNKSRCAFGDLIKTINENTN